MRASSVSFALTVAHRPRRFDPFASSYNNSTRRPQSRPRQGGKRPSDTERNIFAELWQRRCAFHVSDSALAEAFMGPAQLLIDARYRCFAANHLLAWRIAKSSLSEDKSGFWAITDGPLHHGAFSSPDHERSPW
jgi:hypothetical protein